MNRLKILKTMFALFVDKAKELCGSIDTLHLAGIEFLDYGIAFTFTHFQEYERVISGEKELEPSDGFLKFHKQVVTDKILNLWIEEYQEKFECPIVLNTDALSPERLEDFRKEWERLLLNGDTSVLQPPSLSVVFEEASNTVDFPKTEGDFYSLEEWTSYLEKIYFEIFGTSLKEVESDLIGKIIERQNSTEVVVTENNIALFSYITNMKGGLEKGENILDKLESRSEGKLHI